MKNGFPKSIKSAMHNWNAFLLLFLILEFVIFGTANAKFLRIPLLLSSVNDFIAICLISLFVTFVMITGGIETVFFDIWLKSPNENPVLIAEAIVLKSEK